MRLIDADALRKSIESNRDASDMPKMWYEGIEYAINHIIYAPTIEERKGRWLEKNVIHEVESSTPIEQWQSAKCSACGKYHTTPYLYYFEDYAYCPHCGARMEV